MKKVWQFIGKICWSCVISLMILLFVHQGRAFCGSPIVIHGIVSDALNKETLPGVHVYLARTGKGVVTNNYGFYSVSVSTLPDTLIFSCVGFETQRHTIYPGIALRLDIELIANNLLPEIEVIAQSQRQITESASMSMINIPVIQIKNAPALLGEKDVLKVLQLMPGVQGGNEGTSGLYIRGGSNDQNLVILDDAVVYNVNHLFGVFSLFNGAALKNVNIYKGGFPARYGGRVSSVLDITMKEGNLEDFSTDIGLGLISSSLTFEGPLSKNKGSFLISGRRTYHDIWMNRFIPERERLSYFFYDLNVKANWILNKNNRLYLSGFFGRDKMKANEFDHFSRNQTGVAWENALVSLRWNRVFQNGMFSNTSLVLSNYLSNVFNLERTVADSRRYQFDYNSGVRDLGIKYDLQRSVGKYHMLRMGGEATWHYFRPAHVINHDEFSGEFWQKKFTLNSLSSAIYIEDEFLAEKWMFNAGLRISQYYSNGNNYIRPEPRLNIAYKISSSTTIKASYAHMNQYLHLSSSTGTQFPTAIWLPATSKLIPQSSVQYALGVGSIPWQKGIEFTLEGWFKKIHNSVTYADNSSFLLFDRRGESSPFENWENNLWQGETSSKGVEMMLHKKTGKVNGWIAYTLSDAKNRFERVNDGNWFPAENHRRHDLSVNISWDISERTSFGATWVYTSGKMITLPLNSSRILIPLPSREQPLENSYWYFHADYYSLRNNWRSRDYHRLDVAFRFTKPVKFGHRTWEIGVYNAYNRMNPFQYFIHHDYNTGERRLKQRTLLPLIPSVSYNISF